MQHQLLLSLDSFLNIKESLYLGVEWLYYDYDFEGSSSKTSAVQAIDKV